MAEFRPRVLQAVLLGQEPLAQFGLCRARALQLRCENGWGRPSRHHAPRDEIPRIELNASFDSILRGDSRKQLERLLPAYLRHCRWFRAKTRTMTGVHIAETMPMTEGAGVPQLTLLNVEYSNAEPETYLLPLAIATGDRARDETQRFLEGSGQPAVLKPYEFGDLMAAIGKVAQAR